MVAKPRTRSCRRARGAISKAPTRRSPRLRAYQIDPDQTYPTEVSGRPLTGSHLEAQSKQFSSEDAIGGLSTTEELLAPKRTDASGQHNAELLDSCDTGICSPDSDTSEYVYLPLQADEIRLLEISEVPEPRKNYVIPIKLVRHSLLHRTDYVAVSYAWGPPDGTQAVETNDGTVIFITSNLWDFLSTQSRELAGRLLWIDQICINQGNLSERACQVRLMSRIFENATETVIWLGQENEDTEHVFQCIQRFAEIPEDDVESLHAGTMSYPLETSLVDGPGRPLRDLLARSWFTRLWALQEAVLGTAPRFICGTQSACWDDFTTAVLNTALVFEIDCPNTIPTMCALRNNRRKGHKTRLFNLLLETHWIYGCSDPRDRVYALLSMQDSLLDFQIDYAVETESVYISVAQALIKSTASLELLQAVDSNNLLQSPDLPSWVPDWRGISYADDLEEKYHFQACKDFIATRHTQFASTSLKVHGRIIDYVYQVEEPDQVKVLTKGNEDRATVQAYLRSLPERIYHGIPDTNYTLPKQFEALIVRTILSGHYTLYGGSIHRIGCTNEERIWKLLNGSGAGEYDELSTRSLWLEVRRTCERRTVIALEERTIALGPPNTEVGDVICILHGSKVPIVLRHQEENWRVIGPCYVDGVMFGEAVTWAEDEADLFDLI